MQYYETNHSFLHRLIIIGKLRLIFRKLENPQNFHRKSAIPRMDYNPLPDLGGQGRKPHPQAGQLGPLRPGLSTRER